MTSVVLMPEITMATEASVNDVFVIEDGVLKEYKGSDTKVVIPQKVTSIHSYAFSGCETIQEVVIPGNVESIGADAFRRCSNLKKFRLKKQRAIRSKDRRFI